MSRRAPSLLCSNSDIKELSRIAVDKSNPRLAIRAAIVLECATGTPIKDIALKLGERPNTVIDWRRRYEKYGIEGLRSRPRGNTVDVYGPSFRERLLALLNEAPPEGHLSWSGKLLAETLQVPIDAVWRYLRKEHIHLRDLRNKEQPQTTPQQDAYTKGETSEPAEEITDPQQKLLLTENISSAESDDIDVSPDNKERITLPLTIAWKKEGEMSKETPLNVVVIVRVTDENGTLVEKSFRRDRAAPQLEDFELSTVQGFREDFESSENSTFRTRDEFSKSVTIHTLSRPEKPPKHGEKCQIRL